MTEKLYRVHEWVKYNYSEIGKYIGEGYTDKPMRNDEIVDLLNELSEENEQLRKENEEFKKERDSLIQGIVNTAKDGAEATVRAWESKYKAPTIRKGYYD